MNIFTLVTIALAALATAALGTSLLRLLQFRDLPRSLTLGAGYGIGAVIAGKGLAWASLMGLSLNISSWAVTTAGLLMGGWLFYSRSSTLVCTTDGSAWQRESLQSASSRPIYKDPLIICLLLLMAVHFAITLSNNLTRPIFPWDAFTTWMYRAKAWALEDFITPMASVREWIALGGTAGYALPAYQYPTALSVYAAFTSSLAGGWQPAAASAPWTFCFIALCMVAHGTLTLAGTTQRQAFAGAYLLCSLPLLNIHAGLAGYGDLWMALLSGGGLALLLVWRAKRMAGSLWLALLLLLAGTQIKTEGWLWLMLGVSFLLLDGFARKFNYRWLLAGIALLAGAIWMTSITHVSLGPLGQWGLTDTHLYAGALGRFTLRPYNPASNYFDILFQQANFTLLASTYTIALVVMAFLHRESAAPYWLMGSLIAVSQAIIFGFSSYSEYAETGTAIARLLIHFTPVAVLTIVLAWQSIYAALYTGEARRQATASLQECLVQRRRTISSTVVALSIAIISPAVVLLTPFGSEGEQQSLSFDSNDFVVMAGRTTKSDQGQQFIDSPINVGVLKAQLKQFGQPLPRYLATDTSMKRPRDTAFYWVLEGETDVQSIAISGSGKFIEDLHQYPKWQDENIREIGYIVKEEVFETTRLHGLSLKNSLGGSDMITLAHQWLSSEPTSQRLINNTLGHADAPITRNAWMIVSLMIAVVLVGGIMFLVPKLSPLPSLATTVIALWVLSDLAATITSEPLGQITSIRKQPPSSYSNAEMVISDAASELDKTELKELSALIVPLDGNSLFVAQRLPFELLPRAAVYIDLKAIKRRPESRQGPIVLLAEDTDRLMSAAAEIVATDSNLRIQQHDGFAIIFAL